MRAGDRIEARVDAARPGSRGRPGISKRVGAPVAAECLIDRSPPPPSATSDAGVPARPGRRTPDEAGPPPTGPPPWPLRQEPRTGGDRSLTGDTMTACDTLELADRFFAAIEAGDVDAVRELYDPDVEIWHNTDGARPAPRRQPGDAGVDGPQPARPALHRGPPLGDRRRVRAAARARGHNRAGRRIEVPACIVTTVARRPDHPPRRVPRLGVPSPRSSRSRPTARRGGRHAAGDSSPGSSAGMPLAPSRRRDDAEHLVHGDAAVGEPDDRAGHVQPPDPRPGLADQRAPPRPSWPPGWPPRPAASGRSARAATRRRGPRTRPAPSPARCRRRRSARRRGRRSGR